MFLSLTGGCTGLYESTHVKLPHCWKSHVAAQYCIIIKQIQSSPFITHLVKNGLDITLMMLWHPFLLWNFIKE